MQKITFIGPYKLVGGPLLLDDIGNVNGVYLWCVKSPQDIYRVYYVGEAQNIKNRMDEHLKKHLSGLYDGYSIDSLKSNIKILMHRAGEGMIPRFSHLDASEFNKEFVEEIYVFYAEIPATSDVQADKRLRCRFETGISRQIQNSGQNTHAQKFSKN